MSDDVEIPEPLFLATGRVRCAECCIAFPNRERYRAHYAIVHVLGYWGWTYEH